MKVFLDTNVILEFFLDRENGIVARQLFALLVKEGHNLFMTVGSFYTMIFLVDKYLKKVRGLRGEVRLKAIRELMSEILKYITVAGHDNESLLRGVEDMRYKDVEDSCQAQAAIKAGCEVLITFNNGDFPEEVSSNCRVMTPNEFLMYPLS